MTTREQFSFFHPLRVRWGECDAQNIVFFANYFLYFDVAMAEYFRELGYALAGEDALEFYTVSASASYFDSAVYDDELEIGARCARIGNTSATLKFAVLRDDEVLVEGQTVYVHAVPKTKQKSPIPQALIDRIEALEATPPERQA